MSQSWVLLGRVSKGSSRSLGKSRVRSRPRSGGLALLIGLGGLGLSSISKLRPLLVPLRLLDILEESSPSTSRQLSSSKLLAFIASSNPLINRSTLILLSSLISLVVCISLISTLLSSSLIKRSRVFLVIVGSRKKPKISLQQQKILIIQQIKSLK